MTNLYSFSERELQVVQLLLEGKSNKEIAQELGITVRTVEFHMTHILAKVGVSSRAEAIVKLAEIDLRESTGRSDGENPRESTVVNREPSVQNENNPPLNRRSWMKNRLSTILIALIVVFVFLCLFIFVWNFSPPKDSSPNWTVSPTETETITPLVLARQPSGTPSPTPSPREINLAQARQLAAIEPGSRPSVPAIEVKPIETVRLMAEKFIREHSPNYGKYQSQLVFDQGGKGDIYFFTWRLKDKDWSATDWKRMPPFFQIGRSADGKIATLIDTLDQYKE